MATSALGMLASSYGDSDEEPESAAAPAPTAIVINAAPTVGEARPSSHEGGMWNALTTDKQKAQQVVYQNPQYEEMWAPEQGPSLSAHEQRAAGIKAKSAFIGSVQAYHPSSHFAFEEQYHTFNAYGFAADPSTHGASQSHEAGPSLAGRAGVVGDVDKWAEARGQSVFSNRAGLESKMEEQRKRLRLDESYAPLPSAAPELTAEQAAAIAARHKQAKKEREGKADPEAPAPMTESSTFHGDSLTDYQGRSWVHAPAEARPDEEHQCFLPKKLVHTWSGHAKGVAAIRWFPRTAHLLLSAGMDAKVKIWDVHGGSNRKCLRTYEGHASAVRDLSFTSDGRRFVSCSYDRYLKLWDTETGECLGAVTNRKLPYCCELHPTDEHVLLAGCSNKQIVQYDLRSGKVEQVYDQHLGAVNSITFCEEGRRFVTTADDKKMLVWEYGIPVPIKHIADVRNKDAHAAHAHVARAHAAERQSEHGRAPAHATQEGSRASSRAAVLATNHVAAHATEQPRATEHPFAPPARSHRPHAAVDTCPPPARAPFRHVPPSAGAPLGSPRCTRCLP